MTEEQIRDRFRGALLGTLVGDALGAPVEGSDPTWLARMLNGIPFLAPPEREMTRAVFGIVTGLSVDPESARYTDDTQMMIGVAESLIEHPDFDGAHMASRFADNFEVHRGYGPGAHALLLELRKGEPWDDVASRLFGGQGSFGNGGAMRVAPVGALYHNDPGRIRAVADAQAKITHAHLLGREGAILQAQAVAAALRFDPEEDDLDPYRFVAEVFRESEIQSPEFREAADLLDDLLNDLPYPEMIGEVVGNGIEAHKSVPAALYSFVTHWDSFAEAVLFAIRIGGDTDTIGAMTGAIAGALLGADAIPPNWLDAVENGFHGRDYIRALADTLFETWKMNRRKGETAAP